MNNQVSKVSPKRLQVLQILWDNGGEIIGVGKVEGEPTNSDVEATRGLLKRMDDDGLVKYESSYSGSKISFRDTGRDMIKDTPYGGGNVGAHVGSSTEGIGKRLHGFMVQASLTNTRKIPKDWLGVIQEKEKTTFIENPSGGSDDDRAILKDDYNDFIIARDTWIIRFHKDGVTLQLRDGCSIYGKSYADAVQKGKDQADEILGWVSGLFDFSPEFQPRYVLNRAEMAYEKHPLAQLAQDLPGIPLSRFEVIDEDIGKEALTIDASPGFEELEAKAGEVIEGTTQRIEREMNTYVNHGQAMDFRHGFEREAVLQDIGPQEAAHTLRQAKGVQDQLQSTVTQVDTLEEEVEGMNATQQMIAQNLQELQQNRQEEKDTRDALIELVRSNQNVVQQNNQTLQSNQERMEKQEEIIEQQKEIIEGQQEQLSSMEERMQDLSEKVEDLEKEDKGDEGALVRQRPLVEQSRPEYLESVSLSSVSISIDGAEKNGAGKDNGCSTSEVETSDIVEGMRFKDIRQDGKLLEVQEVELVEVSEGYRDEALIRIYGTRKIWHRIPVGELARLFNTGRFVIFDNLDPPK